MKPGCMADALRTMTDTRRRVKLYALNAERQWDDRGTGHVTSSYVEKLRGPSLLVRAESDGSLLLESKIQPDTAYQKQQETLIVWSEGDNYDLALSFQEKAGCDEIWEKICQVQGKDPSVDVTQDVVEESEDERFEDVSDSAPPIELPACELGRLEEISECIGGCLPSPLRREKLAAALENDSYLRKLLAVFRTCEDLENVEGLHHLHDVFKNIFLLNKNALFEIMFADDLIFDVIGSLEYDPSSPQPKPHREYLRTHVKFKEVIPLGNPELVAKIHQTYRVQYIQDVVLPAPSVFEENMLSTLSSFIFFNKVEIVTMIQEDEKFLSELFAQLMDEGIDDEKQRDLVLFLKEFCTFSQTLQPLPREAFFKTLSSLGILQALEVTLGVDDLQVKSASIDILCYIVEFNASMVREYMLQQGHIQDDDQLLLNIIIEQMICDADPELGGAVQLMGVLRLLVDPENMMNGVNKSEKTDFLNFFYKRSIHVLLGPLLANTSGDVPCKEDYHVVQLLGLILELLSFCVEHHTYHIKNYILQKDLLRRILVLMRSKHTFLVLGALRFLRKIITLKDDFYNRYIIKGNLFNAVVDAFKRNNGRYNLLDSAIIELFEFIRVEDVKSLCTHVVEKYGKVFETVTYVQTFKSLKQRYEQHQDRMKERTSLDSFLTSFQSVPSLLRSTSRYRRDPRELDEDEEMWFSSYDEPEENELPMVSTTAATPATVGGASVAAAVGGSSSPVLNFGGSVNSAGSGVAAPVTKEKKAATVGDGPSIPEIVVPAEGASAVTESDKGPSVNGNGEKSVPGAKKFGLVDYDGDSDSDDDTSAPSQLPPAEEDAPLPEEDACGDGDSGLGDGELDGNSSNSSSGDSVGGPAGDGSINPVLSDDNTSSSVSASSSTQEVSDGDREDSPENSVSEAAPRAESNFASVAANATSSGKQEQLESTHANCSFGSDNAVFAFIDDDNNQNSSTDKPAETEFCSVGSTAEVLPTVEDGALTASVEAAVAESNTNHVSEQSAAVSSFGELPVDEVGIDALATDGVLAAACTSLEAEADDSPAPKRIKLL